MAETVLNQEESKVEQVADTKQQNNQLKRILGIIFSVVMIILTVYVLHLQNQNNKTLAQSAEMALSSSERATVNYRTYVDRYRETKIELDETTRKLVQVNQQLDQVTAELATTKGMLTQTQTMLSSAQEENIKLKQELQGLDVLRSSQNVQNMAELQNKIKNLQERDSQVSQQLTDLKGQLRAFQADFASPEEGRSLIVLFQNKIRLVKSHLHYLKQQAYFAKVAAQKEKDRLAEMNGNSGFVVRNGQAQNPNGTKKSFAIDVKIVQ